MTIDDIPMEFTESPAAEEAAVRDEEAAQFMKFGVNGPGFISGQVRVCVLLSLE